MQKKKKKIVSGCGDNINLLKLKMRLCNARVCLLSGFGKGAG